MNVTYSLDDAIEAYEAVRARTGTADIISFLPPRDDSQYLPVLRELVRVELEYGWDQDLPTPLADYRRRFPQLFEDRDSLREVAYEEYRLRRQAGESATPAEYHEAYGIDTSNWPSLPAERTRSRSTTDSERAAAETYLRLSLPGGIAANEEVDAWADQVGSRQALASVLRDVHHEDPKAARRLAKAVTALPAVGTTFLGFRLIGVLGSGTFGRVYLAEQGDLAYRLVALKVSADLFGESQRLAQLQHTNVVPIHSLHRAGPLHAACMPYFGRTTLADVLRNLHGRSALPKTGRELINTLAACRSDTFASGLPPTRLSGRPELPGTAVTGAASVHSEPAAVNGQTPVVGDAQLTASLGPTTVTLKMLEGFTYVQAILWLAARLADGLAHAHERGILHRDLKPANVLLTDEGQPMLLDFNLAADVKPSAEASAAMIGGTLPYMAPEHLDALRGGKAPVDNRSDVYALGVLLYELLTGRHPFALRNESLRRVLAPMIADRQGPPPSLRQWNRNVTPAVEGIVQHCLAADPAQRYQSARDLQEDLQCQLDNLPLKHARERSPRERLRKWIKRHPRLTSTGTLATLAALVIVGLAGAYFAASKREAHLESLRSAQGNLVAFRRDLNRANLLILDVLRPDQQQLDEGMAACRRALDRFGVLEDDAWRERPEFRHVLAEERPQLTQDLGKGLLLLAAGTLLHSSNHPERSNREEQARTALQLNQRAEATFPAGQVPAVLWVQRARCLRLLGQSPQEAERLEKLARSTEPAAASELMLLAQEFVIEGRFQGALPLLVEASRLEPQNFMLWYALGICHDGVGQNEAATSSYTTCIALAPNLYFPYEKRAQAYLRANEYDDALADIEKVIEQRPDRAETYVDRALVRQAKKDYVGAIEDLGHALEHNGPASRIYLMRARIRELAGDKAGAAADRDLGLQAEPSDTQSWLDRGSTRLVAGDNAGALADFNKALDLNPRSLEGLQNKASILSERLGRTEEGIQVLNRLVLLYPEYVPARAGRGVLHARLGQRNQALADAEACLLRDSKPATLYQVAGIYALTSRQEPMDRFQALQLLSSALQRGYGRDLVPIDTDLDPLRNLPEFKEIIGKSLPNGT